MGAPKDTAKNPKSMGIVYVKKAKSWMYYKNYNQENVADQIKWFNTEEEAKQAFINENKKQEGGE